MSTYNIPPRYILTPSVYIFTHQYLNTMQQGIQTTHAVSEIFLNGQDNFRLEAMEWARDYKTLRVLNAGSGKLFDFNYQSFADYAAIYDFLFGVFREPDINNMITAFGFVLSPELIDTLERERPNGFDPVSDEILEHPFISYLQKFSRAG